MTRADIDALYETPLAREEFETRLRCAVQDMEGEEGAEIRDMIAWFLRRYPDPLDRLWSIRRKMAEAAALHGVAARWTLRPMTSYHSGSRGLQDRFDTRRIADRLEAVTYRAQLTDDDAARITSADMFFLATADETGAPDCSYKGGDPGFVQVISPNEIAWPDYDGNGQFRSLGNVAVEPRVALLFIDWTRPARLRVHGRARLSFDDPLLGSLPGAQLVVRMSIARVFPNCPRYLHTMQRGQASPFVPREGKTPPRPGWKDDPRFADALPKRDREGA